MPVASSGISMIVSPVQALKALVPMLVTLSGIIISVRFLLPQNASAFMLVTVSGISKEVAVFPIQY